MPLSYRPPRKQRTQKNAGTRSNVARQRRQPPAANKQSMSRLSERMRYDMAGYTPAAFGTTGCTVAYSQERTANANVCSAMVSKRNRCHVHQAAHQQTASATERYHAGTSPATVAAVSTTAKTTEEYALHGARPSRNAQPPHQPRNVHGFTTGTKIRSR